VVGLVYVAAFAPDAGEDLGALQSNFPPPVAGPYIRSSPLPDGGAEFTIDPSGFHEAFCADLPGVQAAFMAVSQRPLSGVAFSEKAQTRPGGRARRGRYCQPPTARSIQMFTASPTTGWERQSPSSKERQHVVMLSRPAAVADVVRQAVRSCAPAST